MDKQKSSVAVGYTNGLINIYNYISNALVASLQGHNSAISCLTDLSNYNMKSSQHSNNTNNICYLASGSCDCDIIIWDLISLSAICKLRGHKEAVTDITSIYVGT